MRFAMRVSCLVLAMGTAVHLVVVVLSGPSRGSSGSQILAVGGYGLFEVVQVPFRVGSLCHFQVELFMQFQRMPHAILKPFWHTALTLAIVENLFFSRVIWSVA